MTTLLWSTCWFFRWTLWRIHTEVCDAVWLGCPHAHSDHHLKKDTGNHEQRKKWERFEKWTPILKMVGKVSSSSATVTKSAYDAHIDLLPPSDWQMRLSQSPPVDLGSPSDKPAGCPSTIVNKAHGHAVFENKVKTLWSCTDQTSSSNSHGVVYPACPKALIHYQTQWYDWAGTSIHVYESWRERGRAGRRESVQQMWLSIDVLMYNYAESERNICVICYPVPLPPSWSCKVLKSF